MYDFLEKKGFTEGRSLGELLQTKEGRLKFTELHATFFFTLRVSDDEIPKLAYAEGIRSHIKNKILKDFNIDITNPENFPNEQVNWRKYTIMLTKEGKSVTKHKEEIPPDTMDALWMLFSATQSALENRSSDRYMSDFLSKINVNLHNDLHKVMMFGACFIVIFFEARHGQEGLEFLKQTEFKLVENETFQYKYYKKFRSEADKNHQAMGTNVACSGVIPFLDIILDDGVTIFNPGRFFSVYLSLLPPEATKEGCKGATSSRGPRRTARSSASTTLTWRRCTRLTPKVRAEAGFLNWVKMSELNFGGTLLNFEIFNLDLVKIMFRPNFGWTV